ncbi:MAG: hypothetical protein HYS62_02935, partial [Candidatus Aenigmarchaeota archaeon]|nr:hypothetical protein [Candidatus Aenigmarchaeota archaeon]
MSFVPSKLLEWVTEKLLKKILKIFVDIYLRIAPESDKVELFRKHFEKYVQKQSDESYLGLINSLSKELQNKSENIEKSKNIEILLSNLFHNTLRFKSKVKRLFGDSIGYIILLRKRTEKIQDIDDILLKEKIADKKLSEKNIFGGKTFVKFRSNLTNEVIRKL